MRTAQLETPATKSMRFYVKNKFVTAKFNFLQNENESEHSESEFYYPGKLSHAELLQSPTHSSQMK